MNYITWKKLLDSRIQLIPVELAGRGRRINEPLYNNAHEAVNDIYNSICSELDGAPYALFGHSMGTLLTYELLRKIAANIDQEPVHVFFSGRYPPYIEAEVKNTHKLPDKEFLAEVFSLGGTNQEILQNEELMRIFLPVLRSDYKLIETYKHQGNIFKTSCDITLLSGKHDHYMEGNDMSQWQECTTGNCKLFEYHDGHFFINTYRKDVVDLINKTLLSY